MEDGIVYEFAVHSNGYRRNGNHDDDEMMMQDGSVWLDYAHVQQPNDHLLFQEIPILHHHHEYESGGGSGGGSSSGSSHKQSQPWPRVCLDVVGCRL